MRDPLPLRGLVMGCVRGYRGWRDALGRWRAQTLSGPLGRPFELRIWQSATICATGGSSQSGQSRLFILSPQFRRPREPLWPFGGSDHV